jgi:hypothetical protein
MGSAAVLLALLLAGGIWVARAGAALRCGMMAPEFSICVYCGSRPGVDPSFAEVARSRPWIGEHGGQLVYGGGNNGLMGVVADATRRGGRVVGIIPQALVDKEWAKRDCTELHVVDTMHERKAMMAERADAFLALPAASAPSRNCSRSGPGASSATTTSRSASWTPTATTSRCWPSCAHSVRRASWATGRWT